MEALPPLPPSSISPGELITIFGTGVGSTTSALTLSANGKVATSLGGALVTINGVAAPLIYASPTQLNLIVPYELGSYEAGNSSVANFLVQVAGMQSAVWGVPIVPSAPSIFTLNASGEGPGAIVNQDGSINSPSNPATPGSVIEIYATGGGQTSPPSLTGAIAQAKANLTLPVTVTIAGANAQVLYAGNAPSEAEGVVQINAIVPQNVTPGVPLSVLLTVGGVSASAAVTVAVQ